MYDFKSHRDLESAPHNFVGENKVFLLDELTRENTTELIADFTKLISEMGGQFPPYYNSLEIVINSPGGDAYICKSIIGLISLAKAKNVKVTTTILGEAGSSASIIALYGDIKRMGKDSSHFIHWGITGYDATHPEEAKRKAKQDELFFQWVESQYLQNTKIPPATLKNLLNYESGEINSKDCLKWKLVDNIF